MRRFSLVSLLTSLCLMGLAPGLAGERQAHAQDDWGVRRDPFDKNLIRRYKRILKNKPSDAGALGKLMGMYRRYRSVDLLIREYQSELDKKRGFSTLMVLAYLHQKEGNQSEALAFFEEAAKTKPGNVAVQLELGALYRSEGKSEEARRAYEAALAANPSKRSEMDCHRALADLAMSAGDIQRAQTHFKAFIALDPKNTNAMIELGEALAQHKRYDQALKVLADAEAKLKREPGLRGEVVSRRAQVLEAKGEDLAAVAEYERGVKIVGRSYYLRKELTARIVEVYRRRQELATLSEKFEKDWPAKRRDHFEWDVLARLYEETGKADKAIEAFRKATAKAPYELDTQRRLIALLENSGREREALAQYEKVIRVAPGEPRFQLELAKRYWKNGDEKKALALTKKIERSFSTDPGVVASLADLYSAWNKDALALAAYERLTKIDPNDPVHLENLGEQYYQRGDKTKAHKAWKKIVRIKNAESYALLARVYAEHDLLREGLEMYGKAIKLEPKRSAHYKGRAEVYERLRRWNDSVTDWETVLRLTPDKAANRLPRREARRRIVHLIYRSGKSRLRSKVRSWENEFNATPKNISSGYFLVEAHQKTGEIGKARTVLEALTQLRPKDNSLVEDLVKVYRAQREYDKAVELLLALAEKSPGRERDFYNEIAEIKTELQQDDEAIDYVRRALEKSPNDPVAYQRLAERYEAMQKPGEAIKAYEKVIELAPRKFAIYFVLAKLYINRGERDRAAKLYELVLQRASRQEILHKAGREAIEIDWLGNRLGELERVVAPLASSMAHKPVYRRILVELYDRYVPTLLQQSRSSDPAKSDAARKELKRLGAHGLRPLLEALADDTDIGQQRIAVSVLGFLGNEAAAAPLIHLATQEPPRSAERTGSSLIPTIDWEMRVRALVAAGRLGAARTIPELQELSKHKEVAMREAAVFALGQTGNAKVLPALRAAAKDHRYSVQTIACLSFARVHDAASVRLAAELVRDEGAHDTTRSACAWFLGQVRAKSARLALEETLAQGNGDSQRLAAWALGRLGDQQALPALLGAYFGKRDEVRRSAAQALDKLLSAQPAGSSKDSDEFLLDFPMSGARFATTQAVEGLGRNSDDRDIDPRIVIGREDAITRGLRAAFERHRDLVVRALGDLDSRAESPGLGLLVAGLDQGKSSGLSAAERAKIEASLATIGRNLSSDLVALTQHRDPEVRRRSLRVLAKVGDEQAVTPLMAGLSDSSIQVRSSAMSSAALFARNHPQRAGELAKAVEARLAADTWQERVAAAKALGGIPTQDAQSSLLGALSGDSKGFVRASAAAALARQCALGADQDRAAKALKAALNPERESVGPVREAAVKALRSLPNYATDPVLRQVADKDPSARVRKAAQP